MTGGLPAGSTSNAGFDRLQLHPQLFGARPIVNTFKHAFIRFAFFFVNKSRNNLKPSFPVLVKEFCRLFAIYIIPLKSANRNYFRLYIPIPDNSPNNEMPPQLFHSHIVQFFSLCIAWNLLQNPRSYFINRPPVVFKLGRPCIQHCASDIAHHSASPDACKPPGSSLYRCRHVKDHVPEIAFLETGRIIALSASGSKQKRQNNFCVSSRLKCHPTHHPPKLCAGDEQEVHSKTSFATHLFVVGFVASLRGMWCGASIPPARLMASARKRLTASITPTRAAHSKSNHLTNHLITPPIFTLFLRCHPRSSR